jgi:hypothetical protein
MKTAYRTPFHKSLINARTRSDTAGLAPYRRVTRWNASMSVKACSRQLRIPCEKPNCYSERTFALGHRFFKPRVVANYRAGKTSSCCRRKAHTISRPPICLDTWLLSLGRSAVYLGSRTVRDSSASWCRMDCPSMGGTRWHLGLRRWILALRFRNFSPRASGFSRRARFPAGCSLLSFRHTA